MNLIVEKYFKILVVIKAIIIILYIIFLPKFPFFIEIPILISNFIGGIFFLTFTMLISKNFFEGYYFFGGHY